ncbi:MAG: hypothetical protein JO301_04360 [Chitinophagaceae bacterium]|nr:hypothetical protein [Chitinophagaceae bacterium]
MSTIPGSTTHLSPRHRRLLLFAVLLLLIGLINYFFFQPHIVLFGQPGHQPYIRLGNKSLPGRFLTGYLGDIVWCCALMLVLVILSERGLLHLTGRIFILLLPFASEFAQSAGIINGVFDWLDIVIYGAIESVSVFLFPGLLSRLYEK